MASTKEMGGASPEPVAADDSKLEENARASHDASSISYTPAEERALVRKQDLAIIPLSAGIYFLCYLDRANIGNARILNSTTKNDMQTETGTTSYQFTIALMVFLISYFLFEVPSNILLKKLRPSRWIAFLMFSWGVITIGMGGTNSFASITAVRFLLGMFEAGLFPGLVYYLTFWYRADERSVRVAIILASATLAGAFGGALAYGIGHMNGVGGHSGWRWLFILEGIPSVISAFFVWFLLPDYPEEWSRLTDREREVATARLAVEGSKSSHPTMTWAEAKATLTDWRLYGHYAVYFAMSSPFSSLSLFTPTITSGLGYVDLQAQLMTVPPWVVAYVVQVIVAYSSDHFNARGVHAALFSLVGGIGFLVSALLPPTAYLPRYGCLIMACAGTFSCIPPLLGWLTSNVHSTAATGLAIAINVSLGAGLGQIPGVWIYKPEEAKLGYPTGHYTNAALLFFVTVGCVCLRVFYGWKNRQLLKAGGDVRLFTL